MNNRLNSKAVLFVIVLLAVLIAVKPSAVMSLEAHAETVSLPSFITTDGKHFLLDGLPYFFAGANYWYGFNLAADDPTGDRERLNRELDDLRDLGITNLRIMAGSEGPNDEPWRMVPALQTAPGVYDPVVLDGLDYLLYAMKERGLRAIMCLTNYWPWSGGMAQYVNWTGGGDIPYPPPEAGGSWDDYQAYTSSFYSNPDAVADYLNHIAYLINHTNPYTGLDYRDEPTIMAWELANEPRGTHGNAAHLNQWIDDTAAFIKSLDPNHLVTTGSEGDTPWPQWNGLDFTSNHDSQHIDYATVHVWPQNWGWYDPADPDRTYASAEDEAITYFNDHILQAVTLNKPLVLEEFGLARDNGSFDPQYSTVRRDSFLAAMYDSVYASAYLLGPACGDNFWAWAGEGRPQLPYGSHWAPGDPWIGDPPHEQQGWYSVYDTDSTTLDVISEHAVDMNSLTVDYYCDDDNDGYDNAFSHGTCTGIECQLITCGFAAGNDCNDNNALINPVTFWYRDNDVDGFGDAATSLQQCLQPEGHVLDSNDYNDNDRSIGAPMRINSTPPLYYSSLQDAYDAATDGETVEVIAVTFNETLTIDLNKSVTFSGGYNGAYSSNSETTVLQGSINISSGLLTIENFVLQ